MSVERFDTTSGQFEQIRAPRSVPCGQYNFENLGIDGEYRVVAKFQGETGLFTIESLNPGTNTRDIAIEGITTDGGDGELQLPGEGTDSNTYEISTASELQTIEEDLDANYELVSDIDVLNTARFNNGRGFAPVGSSFEDPFTGSFDGTEYRITGLTIDRSRDNVGLFGVSSGTVRNVTLTEATITGRQGTRVGGVSGFNQGGTIQNPSVSGSVAGRQEVGGVVGQNFRGTIREAAASVSVSGSDAVGEIVGNNDEAEVTDIFVSGDVTGTTEVGGVVGNNIAGTVEQSYFDTQTTTQDSSGSSSVVGLTTAEVQGSAAEQNMNLAFGETWRTVPGEYPELIAVSDIDQNAGSEEGETRGSAISIDVSRSVSTPEVTNGSTVTVTVEGSFETAVENAKLSDEVESVSVSGDGISKSNLTITEFAGATFATVTSDPIVDITWNSQLGRALNSDSVRTEYKLTIPADTPVGTVIRFDGSIRKTATIDGDTQVEVVADATATPGFQNVSVGGEEVPVEFTSPTEDGDRTVTADNTVEAINTFIAGEISADVAVDVINAFIAS